MLKSTYPPTFDAFPSYKDGRTVEYNGYIWEFLPGHPMQNLWGFVPQHRLIGEDIIGRPLRSNEVVHHVDECRTNNAPNNLVVMDKNEHRSHHARKQAEKNRAPLTHESVGKALKEHGGIKPAAKFLGVSHSTLRNRFPELTKPYQRVSPTKIDDPRDIDQILAAAPDPTIRLKDLAKSLRISAMTILRICERNGVQWVRKSKVGEIHTTYRKKPTRRASERHDYIPAPEQTPDHQPLS